jgi:hypothetical protein
LDKKLMEQTEAWHSFQIFLYIGIKFKSGNEFNHRKYSYSY